MALGFTQVFPLMASKLTYKSVFLSNCPTVLLLPWCPSVLNLVQVILILIFLTIVLIILKRCLGLGPLEKSNIKTLFPPTEITLK